MESLDNTGGAAGFFKHVFKFDDASKADMLNIIQFAVVALIPVVIVNKLMQTYIPQADDNKGNVEITLEVILQISLMFLGIFFIHRIVEYVPTYSGVAYPEFKVIYVILAVMMITLSLQTKLGEKVSILSDRVLDLINGTAEAETKKKKKVAAQKAQAQAQSQGQQPGQQIPALPVNPGQAAINQAINGGGSYGTTDIGSLPNTSNGQIADYSNMYQNTTTPLVNASMPGGVEAMTPVAANEGGGGLFGSSLF
jgi:hypothetical protein